MKEAVIKYPYDELRGCSIYTGDPIMLAYKDTIVGRLVSLTFEHNGINFLFEVENFIIDSGYLFKCRFVTDKRGVSELFAYD